MPHAYRQALTILEGLEASNGRIRSMTENLRQQQVRHPLRDT